MRTLVLLLLLANIGFFAWQRGWLSLPAWQMAGTSSSVTEQEAPSIKVEPVVEATQPVQTTKVESNNQKNTDSNIDYQPKNDGNLGSEKSTDLAHKSHEKTPHGTPEKTDVANVSNLFLTDNTVIEKPLVNKTANSEQPVATPVAVQERPDMAESATAASQARYADRKDEKTPSNHPNLADTANMVISTTDNKPDKTKPIKTSDKEVAKKELDKLVSSNEKTNKSKSASSEEANACFTVGPYTTPESAKPVSNWFKTKKVNATLQKRQVQATQTIWVYLSPLKGRTEVLKAKQQLAELGLKEHEIMGDNAISLGVYRNAENAERLVNQLTSKGFRNIKTQKRYKNETSYWLSVKMSKGQSDVLTALKKNFQGTALESSACQ